MKEIKDYTIEDIASIEDLIVVKSTNSGNGYPSKLRNCLIGFESWEHLEGVLVEYPNRFNTIKLHKKDGWQLWARRNENCINKPFEISVDDYGDNYNFFEKMSKEDFFENEVKPYFDDIDSFKELEDLIHDKKVIWEEIEKLEEGEVVVVYYGKYEETINTTTMNHYHDTNHYVVGLIEKMFD